MALWLRLYENGSFPPAPFSKLLKKPSLRKVIRKSLNENPLPPDIRTKLENFRRSKFAAKLELPRKQKIANPDEAISNIAVSVDFMPHNIRKKSFNILVMIYHGDMLLGLAFFDINSATTTFNAFYILFISIFYAPIYVIFDRGSNLCAYYMNT